jgi:hypothetical protein
MEEMIRRNEWPFTAGWLVIASARGVSLPARLLSRREYGHQNNELDATAAPDV